MVKLLQTAFAVAIIFVVVGIYSRFGFWVGSGVVAVVAFIGKKASDRIDHLYKLDDYNERLEDVFVVSRCPGTGEQFEPWGDEFDELITWADHEDVRLEVEEQKNWLKLSGNAFYNDERLSETAKLKVFGIIFQDAEFINERWGEEFRSRVRSFIEERRAKRHPALQKESVTWYDKHGNRQRGILTEVKKAHNLQELQGSE